MKLFDVYPLFDINIVKGKGCHVWDDKGTEYLDLYGGHAVISIGHAHPHYVEMISKQVATLGFYSNSVINKLQQQLAERLGKVCGYDDYSLFLINSGAEANENALKLASFYNGRTRVVSFSKAFHGRTSLAVEMTDNPKIIAPINNCGHVTYLPLNDIEAMKAELSKGDVCAVIIEGIQGVGGIQLPTDEFMQALRVTCTKYNTYQSGVHSCLRTAWNDFWRQPSGLQRSACRIGCHRAGRTRSQRCQNRRIPAGRTEEIPANQRSARTRIDDRS